ncbi:MAG TPA: hypothetical protein VD948_10970 [Rhodothermales bacterium]|nr:hypothetical protein [Rhodothermales bacterium]
MPKIVNKARSFYLGSLSLAGNINSLNIDHTAPEVEVTNFASSGNSEYLGGIAKHTWGFEGFWEAAGSLGDPDAELRSRIGLTNTATATLANPAVAGDVAYFSSGLTTKYDMGGSIGAAARMSMSLTGTDALVRGRVIETVTRTSTGNSAAYQLGAVSATQRLFVAVHVIAASGTLDLLITSDNAEGFPSATTRFTVPQFTAIGSYYSATTAGAITDDWYRVQATVGGGSPSFQYIVSLGIAT